MGTFGLGLGLGLGRTGGGAMSWSRWSNGLSASQILDVDFAYTDRHWQDVTGQTLADDAGEPIALAMDSGTWAGRTLAGEVAAQPELKGTGTIGMFGSTTPATYNPSTGVGSVSRTTYPTDQSYVSFPVTIGAYYEVDVENFGVFGLALRPNSGGAIVAALPLGRSKMRVASTTSVMLFTCGTNANTTNFTVHSFKAVPGNHGIQATGTSRPARQAGGVSRYDGAADNLLTSFLAQSGPMTLLYHGTVPASLAAVQVLMGSSGSSANRCWIGVNTSGLLCAGVGSQTESTIVGTTDVRGKSIVAALTFDGSTVTLFLRVDGAVSQEYSAAQASTPTTAIPFRLGAMNNNGTAGSFAAIDANSFKAAHRAMTLTEFAQIATKL